MDTNFKCACVVGGGVGGSSSHTLAPLPNLSTNQTLIAIQLTLVNNMIPPATTHESLSKKTSNLVHTHTHTHTHTIFWGHQAFMCINTLHLNMVASFQSTCTTLSIWGGWGREEGGGYHHHVEELGTFLKGICGIQ